MDQVWRIKKRYAVQYDKMSNKRLTNVSSKQVILEIKIYMYCMLVLIRPSSVFYSS